MRKKKLKVKHVFIIIVTIVIVIVAIFSYTIKEDRDLNKFEAFIKDGVTSVEKVIFYPFRVVIDRINDFKELKGIRKKYQTLLPEVERIDSLNAENIELRKQLTKLKEELKIDYTVNDYEFLNATVISRNINHWYNTITIDKGTYNGVGNDMVVVNSKGLIGKVINVTTFTSDVRLVTTSDTNNKISVTISNGKTSVNGLIREYNYQDNYLLVEGVSNTEKIGTGYYVYTSGLGGVFPSGILIGTVEDITTDEYGLTKIISVSPAVNFADINYVAILKRKEIKK